LAMPFALDGERGETTIEAHGVLHRIVFSIDRIRREPKITHTKEASPVKNGTRVTVRWLNSACSKFTDANPRFLPTALNFGWLNPHLTILVDTEALKGRVAASDVGWTKWLPSDPTSPHWYSKAHLERLMAAYVAHEQDRGLTPRTVRDFISEFRGLSGTAK